jgi:hypothetical protein
MILWSFWWFRVYFSNFKGFKSIFFYLFIIILMFPEYFGRFRGFSDYVGHFKSFRVILVILIF